jgi:tetratricopeptide (TPR) repeat protein
MTWTRCARWAKARLRSPDDVALLTELGRSYAAAGDPDGAEAAFRRAIRLNAHAVAARTELAGLLAEEERAQEALGEYHAALKELPSYGAAAFGLAALHERRRELRQAVHVLADLLTLDPYHMDALDALAQLAGVLERAGRQEDALVAWRRVGRFEPARVEAREAVARLEAAGF